MKIQEPQAQEKQQTQEQLNSKLQAAIDNNSKQEIMNAISSGADVNYILTNGFSNGDKDGYWKGYTILMYAISKNYLEVANKLIEKNADIHAKTTNGWTALMSAAANGHLKVVEKLIELGADINTKATSGLWKDYNALMIAIYFNRLEIIRKLIDSQDQKVNDILTISDKNDNFQKLTIFEYVIKKYTTDSSYKDIVERLIIHPKINISTEILDDLIAKYKSIVTEFPILAQIQKLLAQKEQEKEDVLAKAKQEYEDALTKVQQEKKDELTKFQESLKKLEQEYEETSQKKEQEHEDALIKVQQEKKDELTKFQESLKKLEQEYEETSQKKEQEHEDALAKVQQEKKDELAKAKQEYKEALKNTEQKKTDQVANHQKPLEIIKQEYEKILIETNEIKEEKRKQEELEKKGQTTKEIKSKSTDNILDINNPDFKLELIVKKIKETIELCKLFTINKDSNQISEKEPENSATLSSDNLLDLADVKDPNNVAKNLDATCIGDDDNLTD